MKKNIVFYLFIALIAFGCQQDEVVNIQDEIVDLRHDRYNDFIPFDPCGANEIIVCIEECVQDLYPCGVDQAFEAFNNIPNAGVNFIIRNCDEPFDIRVTCEDLTAQFNDRVYALGAYNGWNGNTDPRIAINNNSPTLLDDIDCGEYGEYWYRRCCLEKLIMMHEIGHLLGLGHNEASGSSGQTQITGTATTSKDLESIMTSSYVQDAIDNCECKDFTDSDITAIQVAYPDNYCDCTELETFDVCNCPDSDEYNACDCIGNFSGFPTQYCNGDTFTWCPGDYGISQMTPNTSWEWVTCNPPSPGGCITFVVCGDDDEAESVRVDVNVECGVQTLWLEFGGEECPDEDYCDLNDC